MSDHRREDILACLESPPENSFFKRLQSGFGICFARICLGALVVMAGVFLAAYFFLFSVPAGYSEPTYFSVRSGAGMSEVARELSEKKLIRSPFWFKVVATLVAGQRSIKAGEYYFAEPASVADIAWRLTHGGFNLISVRVTVPEGLSNRETAAVFAQSFPRFRTGEFLRLAMRKEGYLFPDTYLFASTVSEQEIIAAMEKNFYEKVSPLQGTLTAFGRPLPDVLSMASFLEEEARTTETRRNIADILWRRLAIGMPLQVDAVFPYILGKNTFEVTSDDLKVDSPYNTYLYAGLPPGPISNPGLDAIMAALTPTASNYLYYLSDNEGEMHYAVTHAQHLVNRARYLGK